VFQALVVSQVKYVWAGFHFQLSVLYSFNCSDCLCHTTTVVTPFLFSTLLCWLRCTSLILTCEFIIQQTFNVMVAVVHGHLIKAMSLQQVTSLTLHFSAAFDTLCHSMLLERLSAWFGITSTILCRIKSYLLNRSVYVNAKNTKSSLFPHLYSLSCSSRICSLTSIFILHTIPLSTVVSNPSANHHLYVDDTQLLSSFSAAGFAYNISYLKHIIFEV
jgi:hypothetical protein